MEARTEEPLPLSATSGVLIRGQCDDQVPGRLFVREPLGMTIDHNSVFTETTGNFAINATAVGIGTTINCRPQVDLKGPPLLLIDISVPSGGGPRRVMDARDRVPAPSGSRSKRPFAIFPRIIHQHAGPDSELAVQRGARAAQR